MKAILNNLKSRIMTMDRDSLSRAVAGIICGIIIVILLSYWGIGSSQQSQNTFDSEELIVPPAILISDAEEPKVMTAIIDTPVAEEQLTFNKLSGFSAFDAHRKELTQTQLTAIQNNQPTLTLIIDSIGQSRNVLDAVTTQLPSTVTLGLSPYMDNHNEIAAELDAKGFELWLSLSTQTLQTEADKGNLALSPIRNLDNNIIQLDQQITGKANLTGVIVSSQSLMPQTGLLWQQIVLDLYADGYGVADATDTPLGSDLAYYENKPAPYIKTDVVIPSGQAKEILNASLKTLNYNTVKNGNMIATIAIDSPATLDIVTEWINSLGADGIILIPLSAQAKI